MHMPRNDHYKGIIHYKLRVGFDLEPLSLPPWDQYIIPGMKYSSVTWWGPNPAVPSALGVVGWKETVENSMDCANSKEEQDDSSLPFTYPYPAHPAGQTALVGVWVSHGRYVHFCC